MTNPTIETLTSIKTKLHNAIVNANAAITTAAFNGNPDVLENELAELGKSITDAGALMTSMLRDYNLANKVNNFSANRLKSNAIMITGPLGFDNVLDMANEYFNDGYTGHEIPTIERRFYH